MPSFHNAIEPFLSINQYSFLDLSLTSCYGPRINLFIFLSSRGL